MPMINPEWLLRQLEQRVKGSRSGGIPEACYKDALNLLKTEIRLQASEAAWPGSESSAKYKHEKAAG